jgi:hypothetical protein
MRVTQFFSRKPDYNTSFSGRSALFALFPGLFLTENPCFYRLLFNWDRLYIADIILTNIKEGLRALLCKICVDTSDPGLYIFCLLRGILIILIL